MPFLQLHKIKKYKSICYSLRANLLYNLSPTQVKNGLLKRVSFFTSQMAKASMTIEAALALPLFLFFLLQIMSSISMLELQSRLDAALHQTGNQMAFAGHLYQKTTGGAIPDGIANVALTEGYARNQIVSYAGREYLEHSAICRKAAGLSFTGTKIMQENDRIDICLSYEIEPLFPILGWGGLHRQQRYYARAWTGYSVEDSFSDMTQTDPMVYVTKTGSVYHINRNCTYLAPLTESVSADAVGEKRNSSGGKYYACEICGSRALTGTVYITEYGSSYHSLLNCSRLQRTIYTIPLSQVGGRGRCSKCG